RLGVAADPRGPVVEAKAAEAADLDAFATDQAVGHGIEDHFHRVLGVLGDQLRIACSQPRNQLGLGHGNPDYCWAFLLSSLAFSSAPRLVLPELAADSLCSLAMASVSSAISLAL